MDNESLIKISEMASLHGVSRQTLILYDRNGLLEPAKVRENGYRYYSVDQVPRLRQICLLKEMGVSLTQIKRYLDAPTPDGMCELMASRRAAIERERKHLEHQLRAVEQIDVHFSGVSDKEEGAGLPQVSWIGERKAVFSPFHAGRMDPKRLHMALMDAWGRLLDAGIIPSCGFGGQLLRAGAQGHRGVAQQLPCRYELPLRRILVVGHGRWSVRRWCSVRRRA